MIDVIVVNWNAGHQLRQCIESVIEFGGENVSSIVVADNGSSDGSADSVVGLPKVQLIRTGENLGFGKACNLGAMQTSSKYLLFLNPDAAIYSDTISNALTYIEAPANVGVGICGVQLIEESGHIARSCARFPTPYRLVLSTLGIDRVLASFGHFMAEWDHSETRLVDHVIGAFFLVRRDMFELLHGFDERFFVYLEDLDFSYRARQAGWKSVYLTSTRAFHAGGGTSNQVKARRLFYSMRSRLLYSFKHFSRFGALSVLMATLLLEPLSRSTLALSRGSWSSLKETWSAYRMLWRWLPQWAFKGVTR